MIRNSIFIAGILFMNNSLANAASECVFQGFKIGENVAVSFGGGKQQCRQGGQNDVDKDKLIFRDPSGTPTQTITVCVHANKLYTSGSQVIVGGNKLTCNKEGIWK
jgi:hypothetical protein